jgi:hypothetical protein
MNKSQKKVKLLRAYAIERGFSMPEDFDISSIAALCSVYNGIGAEWMPKLVRRTVTKYLFYLEPAALIHDYEYYTYGSVKGYWSFSLANLRLAYNACKDYRPLSGIAAFLLCQIFGWSAWQEGKETIAYYNYLNEEVKK